MHFPDLPDSVFEQGIHFSGADVSLPQLETDVLSEWLYAVAKTHNKAIRSLTFVLCTDSYLLEMNQERLDHDTYTDIITFDLRDDLEGPIEGECYISLERVNDNASRFGESSTKELHRVFVHGLLHLCGFLDKTEHEAMRMRDAENSSLAMLDGLA